LKELAESGEIIRLELMTSDSKIVPFLNPVLMKLLCDIQERLIYRVERFIRDDLRNSADVINQVRECLGVITGVLDPKIFRDISSEALHACIDVLISPSQARNEEKNLMLLIKNLLDLSEYVTMIDCELLVQSPKEAPDGFTSTIGKLVGRRFGESTTTSVSVRHRIEMELKKLSDEFTAIVVAKITTSVESKKFLDQLGFELEELFQDKPTVAILMQPITNAIRELSGGDGRDSGALAIDS
jgi:hypothetical protein